MIDHKKNRENIIRDLRLNLIGPSPCGKPIKIDEKQLFESYETAYLPYRQFNSAEPNNEGDEILNNQKPSERYGLGVLYPIKPTGNSEDENNEEEDLYNEELKESSIQTERKLKKNKDQYDAIENLKNDLNIEVQKDLLPSSFSLSFLIDSLKSSKLNFEFTGGIQTYSIFLFQALQNIYPDANYDMLIKHDKHSSSDFSSIAPTKFHFCGSTPLALRTPTFAAQLIAWAFWKRPNLIISSHLNFIVAGYLLKRFMNIPYWTVAHGIEAWNIKKPVLQMALHHADLILAVSGYTRNRLIREQNLDPNKIVILP
jgi:hypothetical protein